MIFTSEDCTPALSKFKVRMSLKQVKSLKVTKYNCKSFCEFPILPSDQYASFSKNFSKYLYTVGQSSTSLKFWKEVQDEGKISM